MLFLYCFLINLNFYICFEKLHIQNKTLLVEEGKKEKKNVVWKKHAVWDMIEGYFSLV